MTQALKGNTKHKARSSKQIQSTVAYAQGKGDIHLLWGDNGVGSPELNAFQQAASVVVQKSIREGFWAGRRRGPVEGLSCGGE